MSRLTEASEHFADVWNYYLADDLGPKLTCIEVEALVAIFRAEDRLDLVDAWVTGHARSDDEGDDHYIEVTP